MSTIKLYNANRIWVFLFVLLTVSGRSHGQGGPPMIGDDAGTPGKGKFEINVGYPYVQSEQITTMDIGYIDFNYGPTDNLELSYQGGLLLGKVSGQSWKGGYDNSLIGVKWRFLDQETAGFDMSIYPQAGFNTTASLARAGFSESGASCFVPVEVSRTVGKFEFNAEVGYQYLQHSRDQWAGGPIVGYQLNDQIELLAEARFVFDQDFRSNNLILDAGCRINVVEHVQLLLAAGRGLRSEDSSPHLYIYAGLGLRF